MSLTDLSLDHSDLVAELLKELSNHNERVEERKIALCELMKLTQEESFSVWDEHFKTILLLLLETLGDKEVNDKICKQHPVFPVLYCLSLPINQALHRLGNWENT